MAMHKFEVYETAGRYYIVGGDVEAAHFRVLKIDRTSPPGLLSVTEDDIVYSKLEKDALLGAIDHGNKNAGGMKLKCKSSGLLGFVRFTDAYYMLLVTKKSQVAMIGGRYIYQIDGTELLPLTTGSSSRFSSNRNPEETRFLAILNNLDLHRSFYFSYSYNVTRTLQYNIIKHRQALNGHISPASGSDYNDMFVWNQHLLEPALETLKNPYDWCVPIIHGFVDQASVNVFGRNLYITLIARRSRFFAGARFLKRGANDLGYVANDVETEQIVADMIVTSFNTSKFHPFNNPNYTSFVQHRGSIPLYWTQDNTGVTPKPAIDLNLVDPFYATAALHFDNLFERYRTPICVLNLVKARERTPRESKLLVEYQNAINYLNQMLPEDKKIIYRAYDMSRALKTRGQDVIGTLEQIASELVETTGFFHNGLHASSDTGSSTCVQNGVIRSNCIDCLDRTNAAQFVVGKRALGCQLQALGVIPDASLNYDCDATNLFAHMFNDHGDTLASQYGGSHLVNTTDSYRKISNWQSHSRDMLESVKRYYHNSFFDNQRQEAYNLFLGNYIYAQGQPMLWELPNDFYLHHTVPSIGQINRRRHYIKWYTPEYLQPQTLPPIPRPDHQLGLFEMRDWWDEYYRPPVISSFLRIFAYRINSTTRYIPKALPARKYDMSPFAVRKGQAVGEQERPATSSSIAPSERKEIGISDSNSNIITPVNMTSPPQARGNKITSLQNWLHPTPLLPAESKVRAAAAKSSAQQDKTDKTPGKFIDKSPPHQWSLGQFVHNSLNPKVSGEEKADYETYLSHPLRMLVDDEHEARAIRLRAESTAYIARGKAAPLQPPPPAGASTGSDKDYDEVDDDYYELMAEATPDDAELRAAFAEWLGEAARADALAVTDEDGGKKRYQAYGKWLQGKSLFKQSKMDPEFAREVDEARAARGGV